MTYELAKKLKNAGFPQPKVGCHECSEGHEQFDNGAYAPTLSELIEACGEGFHCLVRTDRSSDGKGIFFSAGKDSVTPNWRNGYTPEEVEVHTCGRELTEEDKKKADEIGLPIAYGSFCKKDQLNNKKLQTT